MGSLVEEVFRTDLRGRGVVFLRVSVSVVPSGDVVEDHRVRDFPSSETVDREVCLPTPVRGLVPDHASSTSHLYPTYPSVFLSVYPLYSKDVSSLDQRSCLSVEFNRIRFSLSGTVRSDLGPTISHLDTGVGLKGNLTVGVTTATPDHPPPT